MNFDEFKIGLKSIPFYEKLIEEQKALLEELKSGVEPRATNYTGICVQSALIDCLPAYVDEKDKIQNSIWALKFEIKKREAILNALPDDYSNLLRLRYISGLTIDGVMDTLQMVDKSEFYTAFSKVKKLIQNIP